MTGNQIKYWTLLEEKRHNVATEDEARRHNVVTEGETYRSNTVHEYETMRHNKENERISALEQAETKRHNLAYEGESVRHNQAQEALGWANVNLGYANLAETNRHNVQTENLGWSSLAESQRHNSVLENVSMREVAVKEQQNVLRAAELDETVRHNTTSEAYTHEANIMKLASSSNVIASTVGLGLLGQQTTGSVLGSWNQPGMEFVQVTEEEMDALRKGIHQSSSGARHGGGSR